MQIRAIKTFNGRMGLIRDGMIVTVEDKYGNQLVRSGLAVVHTPPDIIEPTRNAAIPAPDRVAGKVSGDDNAESSQADDSGETTSELSQASGQEDDSSEDRPAGGRRRRSSSQRRAPRSRKNK